jgi:hypothetical protein
MPSLRPTASSEARPTLSVAGASLPVCFGEALLGAGRVVLRQGDQLLGLRDGDRRGLLWVSAAEDVVPYEASFADPALGEFAVAIHGAGGEAVLDVPRLLAALDAGSPARSEP